jgi:tetratricopeptide (TPR) repeat protein
MKRRLLPLLFAACFGAGSSVAQQGDEAVAIPVPAAPAPKASTALPAQELTPQILYQFLLAEIAGARGNVGLAVDAYRDLARSTRDPRIAQRAAQVALFARRYDVALDAARLWAELDPASAQARQMVTSLLAGGARPEELAEHIARQLAAEGGNLPGALLQLNRALARLPDKRQVLSIVEQVTTPYVGIAEAHFARAVAAHGAQDATRALGEAERAVALRPDWEQAVLLKSQLQPRPEAIETLQRFVAQHPATLELRQTLARMLVAEKRYAEARREFVALLAAMPDDTETLYALGVLAYQQQDLAEAERHFRHLLELEFADADSVRLYLGQMAEDAKRWDEALKWYEQIGPGEQFVAARLRQAYVLSKQDKLDAALRHLQAARAEHRDHAVRLVIGEAQLLRESGRTADALAVLDQGLAAQPDQPELLYESGLVAERLGRIDVFEARLKRLLQIKPDHAHALNALGYSLVERNIRLDEAQQLIDQALALAPDDPFILDSKGWVQFRRGEAAAALVTLQRAFSIRTDPEIAAHLGEVMWTLGRRDEAVKTWTEAAKLHPGNDVLTATIKRFQP